MTETTSPEIVPADVKLRRWVLLVSLGIVLGGVVALWWLDRRLDAIDHLAEENLHAAGEEALSLVVKALVLMGLALVGMGLWLFQFGVRINRAGRYPPPGAKVVRNTVVRTGTRARVRANLALLGSLLAVLAGTVGMWYVFRVAHALLQIR